MHRTRPSTLSVVEELVPLAKCQPPVALFDFFAPVTNESNWDPVVSVVLDQPLRQTAPEREPAHVSEIFSLCAQLSLLWQREGLVRMSEGATFAPNRFNEGEIAAQVVEQLKEACDRFQPKTQMRDVLVNNGLTKFFPAVGTNLCPGEPQGINSGILALNEYFAHMRVLHQIFAISQQLQQDLAMENHKYIAHQLALLYQSLNQAKLPFDHYKKIVESRFEAIKLVTEQSHTPLLPDSHKIWLMDLCQELGNIIGTAPRTLTRRVQPWLDIIRRNAQ